MWVCVRVLPVVFGLVGYGARVVSVTGVVECWWLSRMWLFGLVAVGVWLVGMCTYVRVGVCACVSVFVLFGR